MKCKDCPYYRKDRDEATKTCYYKRFDGNAPCDKEEYEQLVAYPDDTYEE